MEILQTLLKIMRTSMEVMVLDSEIETRQGFWNFVQP